MRSPVGARERAVGARRGGRGGGVPESCNEYGPAFTGGGPDPRFEHANAPAIRVHASARSVREGLPRLRGEDLGIRSGRRRESAEELVDEVTRVNEPRRFRETVRFDCPVTDAFVQLNRTLVNMITADETARHVTEQIDDSRHRSCSRVGNREVGAPKECDWHDCADHAARRA